MPAMGQKQGFLPFIPHDWLIAGLVVSAVVVVIVLYLWWK
jgi:hypothetical protein